MNIRVCRKIKRVSNMCRGYEASNVIGPKNVLIYDNIGKVNTLTCLLHSQIMKTLLAILPCF